MPVCKLSKRAIDALPCPTERDTIWWDEDLKGLGLKITSAGRRTFLVQYRPAGDRRNPRSTRLANMDLSRLPRPVLRLNVSWPSELPAETPGREAGSKASPAI
jgi:hypothetical protein